MMDDPTSDSAVETALRAVEHELGLTVTVLDKHGIFRGRQAIPLLGEWRQSHRRNRVCDIGFCNNCRQQCQRESVARARVEKQPFVQCCWKSVVELVVPMIRHNALVGLLFAGPWRRGADAADEIPDFLPEAWYRAYDLLPEFDPARTERLGRILQALGQGLLQDLEDEFLDGCSPHGRRAQILRFLRYRYPLHVHLEDLAEELGLSPSRTSHTVTEIFGISFQQLLREERIEAAKILLRFTDLRMSEIAERVGIPDEYHFNRTFKKTAHIPPGRFRREGR